MTDVIVAFVLMVVAVSGAELVRSTCKRQLLTPVRPHRVASSGGAVMQAGELEMSH